MQMPEHSLQRRKYFISGVRRFYYFILLTHEFMYALTKKKILYYLFVPYVLVYSFLIDFISQGYLLCFNIKDTVEQFSHCIELLRSIFGKINKMRCK